MIWWERGPPVTTSPQQTLHCLNCRSALLSGLWGCNKAGENGLFCVFWQLLLSKREQSFQYTQPKTCVSYADGWTDSLQIQGRLPWLIHEWWKQVKGKNTKTTSTSHKQWGHFIFIDSRSLVYQDWQYKHNVGLPLLIN